MRSAPHAMSRYAAVTERLIDKCQQDYYANRDLGQSIPSLSAAEVSIIVAESLEADSVIHHPREKLLEHARSGSLSDWGMAVVAEILFTWAADIDTDQDIFASTRHAEYLDLAWTALEHTLISATASPMLWYEEIYFEVAQQYRLKHDTRAVELIKQGLVHDLEFYEAKNALNFLRDLADFYLSLDQLDTGLEIFTNFWTRSMSPPNWQDSLPTLWRTCGALTGTGVKQIFRHRFCWIFARLLTSILTLLSPIQSSSCARR